MKLPAGQILLLVFVIAAMAAAGATLYYDVSQKLQSSADEMPSDAPLVSLEKDTILGPEVHLPDYTLRILPKGLRRAADASSEELIGIIAVYRKGDAEPSQILKGPIEYIPEDWEVKIAPGDFDFDGHMDVSLVRSVGAHSTESNYWLYDPASQAFILNADLSKLRGAQFDAEKKEIVETIQCGVTCSIMTTYEVVGEAPDIGLSPILVEEHDTILSLVDEHGNSCRPSPCTMRIHTVEGFRNGQWVTIVWDREKLLLD